MANSEARSVSMDSDSKPITQESLQQLADQAIFSGGSALVALCELAGQLGPKDIRLQHVTSFIDVANRMVHSNMDYKGGIDMYYQQMQQGIEEVRVEQEENSRKLRASEQKLQASKIRLQGRDADLRRRDADLQRRDADLRRRGAALQAHEVELQAHEVELLAQERTLLRFILFTLFILFIAIIIMLSCP